MRLSTRKYTNMGVLYFELKKIMTLIAANTLPTQPTIGMTNWQIITSTWMKPSASSMSIRVRLAATVESDLLSIVKFVIILNFSILFFVQSRLKLFFVKTQNVSVSYLYIWLTRDFSNSRQLQFFKKKGAFLEAFWHYKIFVYRYRIYYAIRPKLKISSIHLLKSHNFLIA